MTTTEHDQRKPRAVERPALREAQADVALADITDVLALTRMSASWIHREIREGRFPPPVIREYRCARWRLADVRKWLIDRVDQAAAQPEPSTVTLVARRASLAAQAKRQESKSQAGA